MVQIALIRPGSTDYDSQGRIQGTLPIPLNDAGRRDAASIADCLKNKSLTVLYSSACPSAQETAQIIGTAIGLRPKTLDRLQNLNHGLWQGLLIDDVKRKQPTVYRQWQEQPEIVCPPEGEMLGAVVSRANYVMEKLLRKHRFGVVGIVAPEPLASVVRRWILGDEFGDLWKASNGCNRVALFELPPGVYRSRSSSGPITQARETVITAADAAAPALAGKPA